MDDLFTDTMLNIADQVANLSKYNGSHVGVVAVRDKKIISTGCNGYPIGSDDKSINSMDREERLKYAIHAEENVIINAAREGVSLNDTVLYCTHKPCVKCHNKLIQAGVKTVVYRCNEEFENIWCSYQPFTNLINYIGKK